MPTMRRAFLKTGGVGGPVAAPGSPGGYAATGPRTSPGGLTTQPAYRVGRAPGGNGTRHPFLDFSRTTAWRNVGAVVALAYVTGFHVSLGGIRLRAPVPHGHALALGLYIAAWVYLFKYGADVVAASYADKPYASVLQQAF